jgi:hypothetical protein
MLPIIPAELEPEHREGKDIQCFKDPQKLQALFFFSIITVKEANHLFNTLKVLPENAIIIFEWLEASMPSKS